MCPNLTLERDELLELVWSKPMREVAKDIGVSDVALGKACKRCNVPKPRQGHWNMPEEKRQARPELGSEPEIEYYRRVHLHVADRSVIEAVTAKEAGAPLRRVGEIKVRNSLAGANLLVAHTLAGLQKEARDGRAVWGAGALDVRVSKQGVSRALRVMGALMKASISLGDKWEADEKHTTVICEGTPLRVRLTERLTKRDLPRPTSKPGKPEPYWWPRYEWMGTGELTFQVDEHTLTPVRKVWKDTPSEQLESRLTDILEVIPRIARAVQAKEELWQREREESTRRANEAKRRADEIEAQRQLRDVLASKVQAWERAQKIRAFCDALATSSLRDNDEARKWVEWALSQAAELDPLCQGADTWLSLTPPSVEWVSPDERRKHGWWPAPAQAAYAYDWS